MQPQRHAARGRRKAWPRDMDEHGAAQAGDARPRIVIELKEQVVEAVLAPEAVAWFIGRAPKAAIVAPVGWVFAPGIRSADTARRQQYPRPRQAVSAPPQPHRAIASARRAAIAFALVGLHAGAPKGYGQNQGAGAQPALRPQAGSRPDIDRGERNPSHNRPRRKRFPTPACSCILE